MPEIVRRIGKYIDILMKCLPILSFMIPLGILYYLYPKTFEMTWEGRTYYLFFLWLMLLETFLHGQELQPQLKRAKSARTIFFIISLSLPTLYVIGANYCGWNGAILELAERNNMILSYLMPLSIEYLVFTVLFVAIVFAEYGKTNLGNYSITTLFLGAIGTIYTINNLYPYGRFTPFQILVPTTTRLAAAVLNMMGYSTTLSFMQNDPVYGSLTFLKVKDSHGISTSFSIAWPCSGVESLIIYTVTILLFLKSTPISWMKRIVLFTIGALITYFINVLRIASIFIISINTGGGYTPQVQQFHDYYGQLYSIIWIISYPLIIIGSQAVWGKIRSWKTSVNIRNVFSPRTRTSE